MKNAEKAVREAAAALKTAIDDARTAGFVVTWPRVSDGLAGLAISETAKPAADAAKAEAVMKPAVKKP